MKAFLSVILALNAFSALAQGYEPGTLEALQYLNNEWVEKPRQRAHEVELMKIKAQGQGSLSGTENAAGYQVPLCQVVPVYSNLDGSLIGHRKVCY